MMQSIYLHRIMNEHLNCGFVKKKQIQNLSYSLSPSAPHMAYKRGMGDYLLFCRGANNQSSLIDNHLEDEPKRTQFFGSYIVNIGKMGNMGKRSEFV